ncbi:TRAP-type C4-dicarboxylate transport system permease small subunit [Actinoplanes lutulentus]|uniref:TRAP-type C4-dicarboxylate transport system permease small subunit n=1 Tax=Actinoplanes lutulentus TaxID=1287878 RepID=A0A327YYG0_9ACTN|nr:TRAP transporter small permease subunit [Actinoplanes lutulentus]MBB2946551.1 TRAP-type C4-dicarboxylate transport system permease small subunit [Actinoplanes lutulentus]RAK26469.1 TRAP-type C4-dicarboxylate transport system permease small subunit [Actinoplanes lutulentus]
MTAESVAAPGDPQPAPQSDEDVRWREPRVLRVWASIELWIACLALTMIFLSVLWQVISRYVPALNWPGVGEVANYSLIVLTFIMVGYLIGNNGHITIQVIDYLVKGRAFVVVKAVSAALTGLICAVLVWEAWALIQAYPTRTTAALGIPIWTLYAIPMLGFASGTVRAFIRVFTATREDVPFDAAEAK